MITEGTKALLALITAYDTYVGLLTAPGVEMTAQRGVYARQRVAAGSWTDTERGITSPAVTFTGFVSSAPAIGTFVSTSATGPILFPCPFTVARERSIIAEADALDVTPTIALEDVTAWPS
jgi:hypothetical protein